MLFLTPNPHYQMTGGIFMGKTLLYAGGGWMEPHIPLWMCHWPPCVEMCVIRTL